MNPGFSAWILVLIVLTIPLMTVSAQDPVEVAQLRSIELQGMGSDAVYSPFGTFLAVMSRSNSVQVLDADYNELWSYRGTGHHGTGPALAFTPDEGYLIFPGYASDRRIAMVDAATGEVHAWLDGHENEIKCLSLSSDGRWLVSTDSDGNTIVWMAEGDSFAESHRLEREPRYVTALAFSPDSGSIALGNREDRVELYVLEGNRFVHHMNLEPIQYYGNPGYLYGLTFSPDGHRLAAAVRDEITIWNLEPGSQGPRLLDTTLIQDIEQGYCYALEFSPDGTALIGGFPASRAAIWSIDADGGFTHQITFADRQDYVWDLAVRPDGRQLATVSVSSNDVAIWEIEGLGPGTGAVLSALLAKATDGQAPGLGHKQLLIPAVTADVLASIESDLLAPRSMFENNTGYAERQERAAAAVLTEMARRVVQNAGGEIDEESGVLTCPVRDQGTYNPDAERYTVTVMGVGASVALTPADAEALYRNWTDAVISATPGDGLSVYTDYQLIHPVTGGSYPLMIDEDPVSGRWRSPAAVKIPPLYITEDLVIENLQVDRLFPALYRSYERHPVARGTLTNRGRSPIQDLAITCELAKHSSQLATAIVSKAVAAGGSVEILLPLVLSDSMVRQGGDETLAMHIRADYKTEQSRVDGEAMTLVSILNRNAIRWDVDEQIGAFITVTRSPTIMSLAGHATAAVSSQVSAALPREILVAMHLLETLKAMEITYRIDPASAYSELSHQEGAIDFLQFPIETLVYGAGDCDDLSVLFNALMEAAGVDTAFITTPGHIFSAFALDRPPQDIGAFVTDPGLVVIQNERAWIPIETTLLSDGFRTAWTTAAGQWKQAEASGSEYFFTTQDAWRNYPPVPWEPDLGYQQANRNIGDRFQVSLEEYSKAAAEGRIAQKQLEDPDSAPDNNSRGIVYAQYGLLNEAEVEFQAALAYGTYTPALINLANIASLRREHGKAKKLLEQASQISPDNPRIIMGLAVEHMETGDLVLARSLFNQAVSLRPELALRYPIFGKAADEGTGRASEADSLNAFRNDAWESEE